MSSSVHLVYATFPDRETAIRISHFLLDAQLIACANILGKSESMYRWEGEVKHDHEIVAIFKTSHHQYSEVENRLVAEHPYEVPCVVSWPVASGCPAFLSWVEKEVGP